MSHEVLKSIKFTAFHSYSTFFFVKQHRKKKKLYINVPEMFNFNPEICIQKRPTFAVNNITFSVLIFHLFKSVKN